MNRNSTAMIRRVCSSFKGRRCMSYGYKQPPGLEDRSSLFGGTVSMPNSESTSDTPQPGDIPSLFGSVTNISTSDVSIKSPLDQKNVSSPSPLRYRQLIRNLSKSNHDVSTSSDMIYLSQEEILKGLKELRQIQPKVKSSPTLSKHNQNLLNDQDRLFLERSLVNSSITALSSGGMNVFYLNEIVKILHNLYKKELWSSKRQLRTSISKIMTSLPPDFPKQFKSNPRMLGDFSKVAMDVIDLVKNPMNMCTNVLAGLKSLIRDNLHSSLEVNDIFSITKILDKYSRLSLDDFNSLAPVIVDQLPHMDGSHFANIYLSAASIGCRDEILHSKLSGAIIERGVDDFDTMDALRIAHSLGTLRLRRTRPLVMGLLAARTELGIESLRPWHLAQAAFAFTTLKTVFPSLMKAIRDQSLMKLDEFKYREMRSVLISLRQVGIDHVELLTAVMEKEEFLPILEEVHQKSNTKTTTDRRR